VGQLGNGTTSHRTSPVLVSGSLVFQALRAGGYHSCGITTSPDRAAYCWGYNLYGQLGDGSIIDRWTPRAVLSP
jgi:alpha-tubulin suppressor-like RCC1 family protein